MLTVSLAPAVAERLGRFLEQRHAAVRSDHWRHFGGLNSVRVEGVRAVVSAGAGFDSEYELNFRRPTLRETAGRIVRSAVGRSDFDRCRKAYESLWSSPPAATPSPHAVIAQHYMRILQPYSAGTYLEIGAGTGYLAALAREAWNAKIIVIDLPEILPLGFLYLHARFPEASFALPGEPADADMVFLTEGEVLADDGVDLAVNTASLGEMRPEIIARYFLLLRRVLRPGGLFFTVNREAKVMDGVPIRFRDYPWSRDDADVLFTASPLHAITQPENPMLMRLCRLAK